MRVRALEEQPVREEAIHARRHAVVPGSGDVGPRADAAPARIRQRRARHDLPVSVGRVESHRHRVWVAVEGKVVAARSDVPDFGDDALADFVLKAGVILERVRLLRVVVDELGPLLHGEAGTLREQLLNGRSEGRHGADVHASEVRIDAKRRAAIVRRRQRLVEQARARFDRRLLIAERIPRHAGPRREIELRRVLEEVAARRHALRTGLQVVEAQKPGDASLSVVRHR